MSSEQSEAFIQTLNTMFNRPDINLVDFLFALHFIAHVPLMPVLNRDGFKSYIQSFYRAFPDFRQEIHDIITAGNRVVLRVTYYGTQYGDFLGIPATGCEIVMPGMIIFRIENGRTVESWMELDILGVISQISHMTPLGYDGYRQSVN